MSAGSFADAAQGGRESAEDAESAGQPIEAARSRLLAGVALRESDQESAAIEELKRAEEALRRLVRRQQQKQAVADMAGLGWDGDLDAMRTDGPAAIDP